MENHLISRILPETPPATRWMQSRLYELEFSGAAGHLRQSLRHPLDMLPGHVIGRTFQHASRWEAPLPVVQQELQSFRDEALQALRGQSLRLLSELETRPQPYVPHGHGRPYEALLKHDFLQAQHQWTRFLESGGAGNGAGGIPELPSSSMPERLSLSPSRLERSIDALGWAIHPAAVRHSMLIVMDGVIDVLRGQQASSPGQAVRLIDALEIAGERQLLLSQQLRVDACLLQPSGLPLPDNASEKHPSSVNPAWVRNLLPFVEKLSPRMKFSASDLQVVSAHPLHPVFQEHVLLSHHPPALLEESQSRLEIYQMTRDVHRHLLPLRQALSDEIQTGFTHRPPSVMLEVLQLAALREYIQQSRLMAEELNACPPSVRGLMVSGFTHARILEQFGDLSAHRELSRKNAGLETTAPSNMPGHVSGLASPPTGSGFMSR